MSRTPCSGRWPKARRWKSSATAPSARIGRPAQTDLTLDLSALSGVTLYEPEELVLTARAGTPIAEIEALVASKGQQLAFEPMDYGPLFGGAAGRGTIGGVLAANLSGPRRIKAGAARDHFLGFTAVSGRGETFKSGGRVVKNVTGYDLCKLMAGSWGTLAALTEVTIKTLPRPETEATVLVLGLDDAAASTAMTAAMGSSCDVSGAAHLPADVAALASRDLPQAGLRADGCCGWRVSRRRSSTVSRTLEALLQPFGEVAVHRPGGVAVRCGGRSATWCRSWRADPGGTRPLWRISTAADARAPQFARAFPTRCRAGSSTTGPAGSLWLRVMQRGDDAGAASCASRRARVGGHATLIERRAALRAAVNDVFEPQDAGLAALTKRVKEGFDPKGVFNPGRMWAGV